MARIKKDTASDSTTTYGATSSADAKAARSALVNELITFVNKGMGEKVAYTLSDENNPSNVRHFISTGVKVLDYIIANRRGGGIPCGRITTLLGDEGSGKSLIAQKVAATCQKEGGIVVYFDVENALTDTFAQHLGIDINNMVLINSELYIEKVFTIMDMLIDKVREKHPDKKILMVWDSLAATPPKEEAEAEYEKHQMALAARAFSKGLRKLNQKIASHQIAVLLINQLRVDLNITYGDNAIGPGGKAIPFYSSTILRLNKKNLQAEGSGDTKEGVSIDVRLKAVKNRIGPPHRVCEFTMHLTQGPQEEEQLLRIIKRVEFTDVLYNGKPARFAMTGGGAWNYAVVYDPEVNPTGDKDGIILQKTNFQKKSMLTDFFENPIWQEYIEDCLENALVRNYQRGEDEKPDPLSAMEVELMAMDAADMVAGMDGDD